MQTFACRRCHTSSGKGNKLASNLDRLPDDTTPGKILDSIKSPALLMPDFRFNDRELTDLVNAILSGEANYAGQIEKETPQIVHFDDKTKNRSNVFEKNCGSCHKVLTKAFGGLGKGDIGPNLSGLFSLQYPLTFNEKLRWKADMLKKWLENPRKIRNNTQMRPILLKKDEFGQLLKIFAESPGTDSQIQKVEKISQRGEK